MMNSVNLIGRITKDLELKQTANGKKFCFFTLAVNEGYGENQHTNFISCIVWEKQAENLIKFVKKGSLLGVEGSINVRQEKTKEGQFNTITIIKVARTHFLTPTTSKNENNVNNQANNNLGSKWDEAQNNKGYQIEKNYNKSDEDLKKELFDDDIEW